MTKFLRTVCALGLLGICAPTLVGCLPEDDLSDLKIEAPAPTLSLPLLNTNLTVSDIITIDEQKGVLTENEDHSYRVLYRSQRQTEPVSAFFPKIPAQHHSESFSLGINSSSFRLKSPPQKFQGSLEFDAAGLTLYALESKQGFINLTLSSDYQHDVDARVVFPNIKHKVDSTPFVWNPIVIHTWSNRVITQQSDLSEYAIELVDGKIAYEMEVIIDGSGRPISEDEQLTLAISLNDIEFAYLAGNFADITVPMKADTLDIPLLASAVSGRVALNPALRMKFKNSYGVRIASDFSEIVVAHKSGSQVSLQDEGEQSFFGGAYEFPSPTHRGDAVATKSQVIDRSTSNIEEAFAELPQGLMYTLGFALNSAPGDTSFITDQSQIGVEVEVELPLEGSFDVVLQDSIPVNFRGLEDVESLRILIKTENSFPVEARLRIHFLDEEGQLITDESGQSISLFGEEDKLLVAAKLVDSSTGKTQPVTVDLPLAATLDQETFRRVREATHLLVRTDLESMSDQANQVKLYSFYSIRFGLATQIKTSLAQ